MGDELKWLLKEGDGCIFKSCDIALENMPTSHGVGLAPTTSFKKRGWTYFRQIMVITSTHFCFSHGKLRK